MAEHWTDGRALDRWPSTGPMAEHWTDGRAADRQSGTEVRLGIWSGGSCTAETRGEVAVRLGYGTWAHPGQWTREQDLESLPSRPTSRGSTIAETAAPGDPSRLIPAFRLESPPWTCRQRRGRLGSDLVLAAKPAMRIWGEHVPRETRSQARTLRSIRARARTDQQPATAQEQRNSEQRNLGAKSPTLLSADIHLQTRTPASSSMNSTTSPGRRHPLKRVPSAATSDAPDTHPIEPALRQQADHDDHRRSPNI